MEDTEPFILLQKAEDLANWDANISDVSRRVASFRSYALHASGYKTLCSVLDSIHLRRNHEEATA